MNSLSIPEESVYNKTNVSATYRNDLVEEPSQMSKSGNLIDIMNQNIEEGQFVASKQNIKRSPSKKKISVKKKIERRKPSEQKEEKSALAIMMSCLNNSVNKESISMHHEIHKHHLAQDITAGATYTSAAPSKKQIHVKKINMDASSEG